MYKRDCWTMLHKSDRARLTNIMCFTKKLPYVLNKSGRDNRISINGSSGNRSQIVLGIIIMKLPTDNKITLCISKLLTNLSLSADG